MPRASELWLGTLVEILGAFGIEPGSVRTAMSRLARDGFLVRRRVGRTSHYALSAEAIALSREAERKIYRSRPPESAPGWDLAVTLPPGSVDRKAAAALGYAALAGGVFVRPRRPGPPERPDGAIHLAAEGDDAALARALYPLEEIAARYGQFAQAARLLAGGAEGVRPLDALAMRVALVHNFRRIVLRDPHVPAAALPAAWPAAEAYAAFAGAYRALAPASERWLDGHARNAAGPLPPAGPSDRFADDM